MNLLLALIVALSTVQMQEDASVQTQTTTIVKCSCGSDIVDTGR